MRTDHYFDSHGAGQIHYCRWMPEGEPKGIVQIVHGIAEYVERYDEFARFLNTQGYIVVAEDHMGHGKSIGENGVRGYFCGGWFAAVEDTCQLMQDMMKEYTGLPYVLFGHSMGSFMARTILAKYPDCGISAAIICGTGWQPGGMLAAMVPLCNLLCKIGDERKPTTLIKGTNFGGYNSRIEHPRTPSDWLTRDKKIVDAYVADPLCGFTPSTGLVRDMMTGIQYIQKRESLNAMRKVLPVFFIAGGDDPVGAYGEGVKQTAEEFRKAGMKCVSTRIYPLCRHEILNEINREDVYRDVVKWMEENTLSEKLNARASE